MGETVWLVVGTIGIGWTIVGVFGTDWVCVGLENVESSTYTLFATNHFQKQTVCSYSDLESSFDELWFKNKDGSISTSSWPFFIKSFGKFWTGHLVRSRANSGWYHHWLYRRRKQLFRVQTLLWSSKYQKRSSNQRPLSVRSANPKNFVTWHQKIVFLKQSWQKRAWKGYSFDSPISGR